MAIVGYLLDMASHSLPRWLNPDIRPYIPLESPSHSHEEGSQDFQSIHVQRHVFRVSTPYYISQVGLE